jgi:hypothetical protein
MSKEEKAPVGRPQGTKESPYNLVKQDLNQTLKLQREVRNLVQEQVEEVKTLLVDKTLPIEGRLKAMDMLGTLLETLSKSSQATSKLILSPEGEGGRKENEAMSETALIEELLKGGKG